jgi:apolipoprotein N-acyltransferase
LAKQEFLSGLELSLKELPEDTDYVIWAETSLPYSIYGRRGGLDKIAEALPSDMPLIAGALRYTPTDIYNSALLIKNGHITDFYDKSHLVPFGEYVPLHSVFPFMEKFTAGGADLTSGSGIRAMTLEKGGKVGILICYEVIFPDDIDFKDDRPRWLLNLTNDGWYGETSGPYQHFAAAKLRAIEHGLPLVRVAGTGISGLITATGEVPFSLGLNKSGVLDVNLPKPLPATMYSHIGSLPVLLLCGFILLLLPSRRLWQICRKKPRQQLNGKT